MDLFEDFIADAKRLIAIDSVESAAAENAPFGLGAAKCLGEALKIAEKLGFKTKNADGYYGFAEVGEGEKLFGILGHLDTVPYDDSWDVPPLSGEIKDGCMYGRGMQDDKIPTLMCLYAVAELLKNGKTPKKRVRVIFGCNEESGWRCMEKYVSSEELPSEGFTPDSDFPVINCEKGVAHYSIVIPRPDCVKDFSGGERANMVMDECRLTLENIDGKLMNIVRKSGLSVDGNTITAHGKAAHGSTPEKGDNALWKILAVMAEYAGGVWSELNAIIPSTDGSKLNIAESDEISGALTINFGIVRTNENSIVFDTDVRYPIGGSREKIRAKIAEAFGNRAKIDINFYHDPLFVPKDSPLVTALLNAYNKVTGENAEPISIGGATYARAMPSGTCVAFGPIFPSEESTIHSRNERWSLDSMKKAYQIYMSAIEELCF